MKELAVIVEHFDKFPGVISKKWADYQLFKRAEGFLVLFFMGLISTYVLWNPMVVLKVLSSKLGKPRKLEKSVK